MADICSLQQNQNLTQPRITTTTTSTYIGNKTAPWESFDINSLLLSQRQSKYENSNFVENYFETSNQTQKKCGLFPTDSLNNVPRRITSLGSKNRRPLVPLQSTDLSLVSSTYTSDFCNEIHDRAAIPDPFSQHSKEIPGWIPQNMHSDEKKLKHIQHGNFLMDSISVAGMTTIPTRTETYKMHLADTMHMDSEPALPVKTTFQSDFTNKTKEQYRMPGDVPPYRGSTSWSPADVRPKFYSSQDIESVLKRRSRDPVKHMPKVTGSITTTNRHDFSVPGFDSKASDKMIAYWAKFGPPAGQPTPR
ncbi:hypothetical protein HK096_010009, partial [Nowakowskiella sp. JEL0078]